MAGKVDLVQMIRNRRAASAAAAFALFAAAGVCGVVVARVIRTVPANLTWQTPTRTASTDAGRGAPGQFTTTVAGATCSVQVDVVPARIGTNSIHLYAYTPDRKPLPVVEWRGTAGLPGKGVDPVAIPLLPLTDNHAVGQVSLPAPDDWQLRFTVRISDGDQATVIVTVPVT